MLPRIVHQAYAAVMGYFWLPCPRCGRMFGGHERHGGTDYIDAFLSMKGQRGRICCKHCRGDRFVGQLEIGFVRPAPNPHNKFRLFKEMFGID